ncbi:Facilitated trehalose transporter Tret1 [Eumeta japonica]|uniref:Facilitated trehalose transporter Tret1 n=1 Tax=Eumeta variegata TaxID=151549 RepID=A0A4C1VYH9_EUMVA|nr:Facilitated trehalose transporter Tret1 [Eumeta japonica]
MSLKDTSSGQSLGSKYRQWMVATVASTSLFTYGLQSGWMSPMIELMKTAQNPQGYPFPDTMLSWIASALCMTASMSTIAFANIADRYGRKAALSAVVITQALGWVLKLVSTHPVSILIARLIAGIVAGGVFNVVSIYLKEISEDSIRGAVGTTVMLGQALGTIVIYTLGSYLGYYTILYIVTWIPIANGIMFLAIPETPSYLVKKNKIEEATKTVAYLRGLSETDQVVVHEINLMKKEEEKYSNLPRVTLRDIWTNLVWRRAVIIVFTLMTLLDTTGTMAISTYAATIVSASSDTSNAQLQTVWFPTVMAVGSLVSMALIERCGRKILMISSLIMTGSSLTVLASVILIQKNEGIVPGWVSVLAIIIALFSYGVGLLPVPYIVMSEIFNFQLRARIMGYVVAYGWFLCFVQVKVFAPISEALGMDTMFFIFAGVCFLGVVICIVLQPETKGKTIEEIEEMLRKNKKSTKLTVESQI